MARRKKRNDTMGSLDSLLDTMTNVVGVLIVVLIVTQVNVSSAAKRIRANLPEVSVAMMSDLEAKEKIVMERLDQLKEPEVVAPEDLEKAREELETLIAVRKELGSNEARFKKLDLELAILEQEIEELRQKLEAEGGRLAQLRSKAKEEEESLRNRKAKLVRLPNPRVPEEEAKEIRMIIRGGKLIHFDREGILDAIAAKVTPRKDLLSRDPKYKNRYDREKILTVLDKLAESNPLFRYEFKLHENGHLQVFCYPRDGKGEDLESLVKSRSAANKVMVAASFDRDYLRFFVTKDSFEQYIVVRRIAEDKRIPVGWVFADDSVRQTLNLGERKIWATPHPDWKPPAQKPGKKPPPKKKPTEDILD